MYTTKHITPFLKTVFGHTGIKIQIANDTLFKILSKHGIKRLDTDTFGDDDWIPLIDNVSFRLPTSIASLKEFLIGWFELYAGYPCDMSSLDEVYLNNMQRAMLIKDLEDHIDEIIDTTTVVIIHIVTIDASYTNGFVSEKVICRDNSISISNETECDELSRLCKALYPDDFDEEDFDI